MKIQIFKGDEVAGYIDDLASLRSSYFRDYPYFYQVNPSAEKEYLMTYASSPSALFVVAGEETVGVLTGCPLTDSSEYYQRPFVNKNMALDKVFCLGEFVFQNGHENETVQKKMYEQLEALISQEKKYNQIVVYELVCLESEPSGYISIEKFWEKMGFAKYDDFAYSILWKDSRTHQEVDHKLVAWIKNIEPT